MFKTDETLEKISAFALTEGRKRAAIVIMYNNILVRNIKKMLK